MEFTLVLDGDKTWKRWEKPRREIERQLPKDSHELEREGGDETEEDTEGTDSEEDRAEGPGMGGGRTGDLTA